ncbi:hypothetical protein AGIG_G18240 [Arapaima gigas]
MEESGSSGEKRRLVRELSRLEIQAFTEAAQMHRAVREQPSDALCTTAEIVQLLRCVTGTRFDGPLGPSGCCVTAAPTAARFYPARGGQVLVHSPQVSVRQRHIGHAADMIGIPGAFQRNRCHADL